DRPAPVLARVRAHDHERALRPLLRAGPDPVLPRPVAQDLPPTDGEVGPEPTAPAGSCVEARRNEGIEADAAEIHEQAAPRVTHIDPALPLPQGHADRLRGAPREAELSGKPVARARRHDAERGAGARDGAGDFVDRAVAAPGTHDRRPRGD